MIYLYRHIRLDTEMPFYIGIGSDPVNEKYKYKRSKTKNKRNTYWHNIVNKVGYRVEIMLDDIESWEKACEIEIWWIAFYGRLDLGTGILCNLTDGGEGMLGTKMPEGHQEKLQRYKKEKGYSEKYRMFRSELFKKYHQTKDPIQEQLRRQKISEKQKGVSREYLKERNRNMSDYQKERIREANRKNKGKKKGPYKKKDKI